MADIKWEKEIGEDAQRANLMASGLSKRHLDLIRMTDVVFIYNRKGYVGLSTVFEMGFARALNKPVWALEDPPHHELWERDEVERVVSDPKQLVNWLMD